LYAKHIHSSIAKLTDLELKNNLAYFLSAKVTKKSLIWLKPRRTLLKTPRRCRCEAQSRDLKVSIADAQIFGIDTGLFNI
jgi:hypothetical protein